MLGDPPDGDLATRPWNEQGTTDMHLLNADLYFVYAGLSLTYEITFRDGIRHPGHDGTGNELLPRAPRNGYGMFVQAGYLLPDIPVEIAARWGIVRPAGAASRLQEHQELGAGVNVYMHEHALKLQVDFFELWDGSAIDRGEERLRVLLQASL